MRELVKARLSPFRNRDFRNFFIAQTLSLVGTWSHDLARSWIIVEMTGSSGALGNLQMCIAIPCLFLILQGGVLVDRTDVRKLIQRTKSVMGVACLILAALTEFSHLQIWQIMVFGVIEGMVISFDQPAFQAITVRLVPREDFQQAIAVNSTNYHTSRMLGPLVAAWLSTFHGPSLVFLFDGLTYFVVAIVLINVNLRNVPRALTVSPGVSKLRDGLNYIFKNRSLRYRLIQLMLTLSCIYPMMATVFRVYVQQKFKLDAHQFMTVFSFPAMGSMAGALSFAVFKPREPMRSLFIGVPLVFLMLLLIPWLPELSMTVAAMSLAGFGLYLSFASMSISMQLEVQEEYRGRLSSVIGLGFQAVGPLMSSPWGNLADLVGPPVVIMLAASIFGIGSATLAYANYRYQLNDRPRPG